MKLQFPAGSDVALVRITGNIKNQEPSHVRIVFPGGSLEVTRAKDGEDADCWAHIHVNKPGYGDYEDCDNPDNASIIDARIDAHNTGTGSSYQDAKEFKNPDIYHVAIRIKRKLTP